MTIADGAAITVLTDVTPSGKERNLTDSDVRRLEDKVDELGKAMARLEGSLKPTFDTLTARQDAAEQRGNDVEARLRSLERFRYTVPSAAVVSALAALGMLAYYLLHS